MTNDDPVFTLPMPGNCDICGSHAPSRALVVFPEIWCGLCQIDQLSRNGHRDIIAAVRSLCKSKWPKLYKEMDL